jgi:hypothetical protein
MGFLAPLDVAALRYLAVVRYGINLHIPACSAEKTTWQKW